MSAATQSAATREPPRFVGWFVAASAALAAVAPLAAQVDPGAAPPQATPSPDVPSAVAALPPGVYARVDGREISEREYAEFLLASLGRAHLGRFIDRLLIDAAARRAGVAVTPEEVERLVEERIQRTIEGIYRGNRESFLEALERRQSSLDDLRQRDRQEIYYERLLDGIILAARTVDEAAVAREFERVYGPGGVEPELRHIVVSTRRRIGAARETLPARRESEAVERAAKIHEELLAGGDFVQLVERYSDDPFTRENDGRIPVYRPGHFGDEFDAAVAGLTAERPLSGVVHSPHGLHLVQLVGLRVTKLDDVRAEVESLVRNRPPSTAEKREALAAMRAAARIER